MQSAFTSTSLSFVVMFLLATVRCSALHAQQIPAGLLGDWSLNLESKEPAWMSMVEKDGRLLVYFRIYVGSAGPYEASVENGKVAFSMKRKRNANPGRKVRVGLSSGRLDGIVVYPAKDDAVTKSIRFTGKRIPPLPAKPDLLKIRFGQPRRIFNGKDLSGWRPHESEKINGWSVQDGMLVNSTPKTDFSATGAYANLRTEAEFEDFWLHTEFLVERNRNSGIYLRGMYEAQVVDRDSRMQGIQGVGAIFGQIEPSTNAGHEGGKWQTYDLTLVDRHITVVLNGVKVIDNEPLVGPTAGAICTDPSAPGPIYLQGDHTAVRYRNMYLAPVVR